MRVSRVIVVIVVLVLIVVAALYALGALTSTKTNSPWHVAAEYPLQVDGTFAVAQQQCVNYTAYVYCMGGLDANGGPRSEIYVSPAISATSANISRWTSLPEYPQDVNAQACVTYASYAYCVGGSYDSSGDDINASYYAPLGSGGAVGQWKNTTAYPVPIDSQYCITSSGYVYCVAGANESDGNYDARAPTNQVFFAPLSSSGIGAWQPTTYYPTTVVYPSCFSASGYVYCIGGVDENGTPLAASYYAPLTPTGVGAWTQTTPYPVTANSQACAISSGYIYCVGGETTAETYTNVVYYAPISSGGIGAWKEAPSYPTGVGTDCVIMSGYIYCMGGYDNSEVGENGLVYYASLASLTS